MHHLKKKKKSTGYYYTWLFDFLCYGKGFPSGLHSPAFPQTHPYRVDISYVYSPSFLWVNLGPLTRKIELILKDRA